LKIKQSGSESEVLKIEESESELLCIDSTALAQTPHPFLVVTSSHSHMSCSHLGRCWGHCECDLILNRSFMLNSKFKAYTIIFRLNPGILISKTTSAYVLCLCCPPVARPKSLIKCLHTRFNKPGSECHAATYRYADRLHNQQDIVWNSVSDLHISGTPKPADCILFFR
jgi:hypothetical protein